MFLSRAAFVPVPKNIVNKYKYSVVTSLPNLTIAAATFLLVYSKYNYASTTSSNCTM